MKKHSRNFQARGKSSKTWHRPHVEREVARSRTLKNSRSKILNKSKFSQFSEITQMGECLCWKHFKLNVKTTPMTQLKCHSRKKKTTYQSIRILFGFSITGFRYLTVVVKHIEELSPKISQIILSVRA